MILKGLEATIEPEPDMEVIGAASTGSQALKLHQEHRPDVTIMDLSLTPEMTGLEAIQAIRKHAPQARIIVLSAFKGEEDVYKALQAGAKTYLLKENLGDDLIPIIREVHAGGGPIGPQVARKLADRLQKTPLTAREIDVLLLMAEGLRNKEIAGRLFISEQTTQGHVKTILAKLDVHDRTEAVTAAVRRGIIHLI